MIKMKDGVIPTMITPFKSNLSIDYKALEKLIQWYTEGGVDGFFTVAQSSAMFELSLRERVALAKRVKELAPSNLPVAASGHISDSLKDQVEELNLIAETGIDNLILLTNRFAAPWESDDVWKNNLENLLKHLPEDISLGLYECPYPYKKLLSENLLNWVKETGRFGFVKDTCCDPSMIERRGSIVSGSPMKLYNANAPTLLYSLKNGYSGYSGIMTNFHTELYYWLCHNWKQEGEKAEELQSYLSVSSLIENYGYPLNAKYALRKMGIEIELICRRSDMRLNQFSEYDKFMTDRFMELSRSISRNY